MSLLNHMGVLGFVLLIILAKHFLGQRQPTAKPSPSPTPSLKEPSSPEKQFVGRLLLAYSLDWRWRPRDSEPLTEARLCHVMVTDAEGAPCPRAAPFPSSSFPVTSDFHWHPGGFQQRANTFLRDVRVLERQGGGGSRKSLPSPWVSLLNPLPSAPRHL